MASDFKRLRRSNRRIQKQNIILELRNDVCGTDYQNKKYKNHCYCCFRKGPSCDMKKQGSRKKRTKELKQDRQDLVISFYFTI